VKETVSVKIDLANGGKEDISKGAVAVGTMAEERTGNNRSSIKKDLSELKKVN
jgi:hypothetical protein